MGVDQDLPFKEPSLLRAQEMVSVSQGLAEFLGVDLAVAGELLVFK